MTETPNEKIKSALVAYLDNHGYHDAAKTLSVEQKHRLTLGISSDAQLNGGNISQSKPAVKRNGSKKYRLASDAEPIESLGLSYKRFQEWVVNSLDQFRDELWPFLWIVYFNLYLEIINEDQQELAKTFLQSHQHYHYFLHQPEINKLRQIDSKQKLIALKCGRKKSILLRALITRKQELMINELAFEMLLNFLLTNKLISVLTIINEKTSIKYRATSMIFGSFQSRSAGMNGVGSRRLAAVNGDSAGLGGELRMTLSDTELITSFLKKEIRNQQINTIHSLGENMKKLPKISWGIPYELESFYCQSTISKELLWIVSEHVYPNLFERGQIAAKIRMASPGMSENSHYLSEDAIKARSLYVNIYAPKSDSDYFSPICERLIHPLRITNEDIQTTLKTKTAGTTQLKTTGNEMEVDDTTKTTSVSKPIGKAPMTQRDTMDGMKPGWPSIALSTFFDCDNSLICSDVSLDGSVTCAGFETSTVAVYESLKDPSAEPNSLTGRSSDQSFRTYREELIGHSGPVYSVSIGRDNRRILSSSADGYVRLWLKLDDSSTTHPSVRRAIMSSRFQPQPQQNNQTKDPVRWWNIHAYKPHRLGRPLPVWDVNFGPLGHYFSTASMDCARLYTIERTNPIAVFDGHLSDVNCTHFHPNMHYLISGSEDKTVRVWDLRSKKTVRLMRGHLRGVHYVNMDPSGKYLISSGDDNLTIIWDLVNGRIVKVLNNCSAVQQKEAFDIGMSVRNESEYMNDVHITGTTCSPDGRYLAVGSSANSIAMYDTNYIWGRYARFTSNPSDFDVIFPSDRLFFKDSFVKFTHRDEHMERMKRSWDIESKMRVFRTKQTPINTLKFLNEKLLMATGVHQSK